MPTMIPPARVRAATAALLCAALAACASLKPAATPASGAAAPSAAAAPTAPKPSSAAPSAADAAALGTWFSPPADYPGICMTLEPGGALNFAGGFAFFNPGRWSYDGAAAELRLQLGGATPLPAELLAPAAQPGAGAPLRMDAGARALVYRVTPATEAITVGGFVFYRKQACQ